MKQGNLKVGDFRIEENLKVENFRVERKTIIGFFSWGIRKLQNFPIGEIIDKDFAP